MVDSNAKIEGAVSGARLDVKRLYLPGVVITADCPVCKGKIELDLGADYLSYPPVGTEFSQFIYCPDCENEDRDGGGVSVQLKLTLKVELA